LIVTRVPTAVDPKRGRAGFIPKYRSTGLMFPSLHFLQTLIRGSGSFILNLLGAIRRRPAQGLRKKHVLPMAALAGICALSPSHTQGAPIIKWEIIAPGISFGFIEDTEFLRSGSSKTLVLRIDSSTHRFQAFHYTAEDLSEPLTIEEWSQKTNAPIVFNAGQYYEDFKHIGWLIRDGENLGTRLNEPWKGLLVQEQEGSQVKPVRLLDLKYDHVNPSHQSYAFAVQSLMLFDKNGKRRVRKSDLVANRTVVATGDNSDVYVFFTEGGYTLWELAELIQRLDLPIDHALALDGGYQAQIEVNLPSFSYLNWGKWGAQTLAPGIMGIIVPGVKVKLPAVIAVFPVYMK